MHMTFGELLLWTPGMLKGSSLANDQTKDIEYQRGRLKGAQARTGRLVHQWRNKNGTEDKYTSRLSLHGLATSRPSHRICRSAHCAGTVH